MIVGVFDGAWEIFDCAAKSLEGEDVRDGIRALISGTVDGVLWSGYPFVVWDCGPGFERVAEDVETGRSMHG